MLVTLPGCLTSALWEDEHGAQGRELVLLAERQTEHRGELVVTAGSALQFVPDDAAATPVLTLVADREAETALALLLAGGVLQADRLELLVQVVAETVDGERTVGDADLSLRAALDAAGFAATVAADTVPPATRQRLREAGNGRTFAFAGPDEGAPAVERCLEHLRAADLRPLCAGLSGATFVAATCVGDDLMPADLPAVAPRDAAGGGAGATWFAERMRQLAPLRLLVEVVGDGGERRILSLPADRVWLWSQLSPLAEGGYSHRSGWRVRELTAATIAPGTAPLRWPALLVRREREAEWRARAPTSFWQKLALTPLALAADVTVAWFFELIGLPLCGDDEYDDGA